MAKIVGHIKDLLKENQCVIVPKMGAFINSDSHTGNHLSQNPISSSENNVKFNVFLKHNDGLLANHIVQKEKIVYKEALKWIEEFVDEFQLEVNTGKKFVMDQVGILYKETGGNIQFRNVIHAKDLSESFEISEIPYAPVPGKEMMPEAVKQPVKQDSFLHSESLPPNQAPIKKNKFDWIGTIILAGSIFLFSLSLYEVFTFKLNFAQVNTQSLPASTSLSVDSKNSMLKPGVPVPLNAVTPETIFGSTSIPDAGDNSVTSTSSGTAGDVVPNTPGKNYFIVAGSFRSMGNAKRMLDELASKGYQKARIIDDSQRFHLVCYDRFHTLEEANENLKTWKSQDKNAWIFIR